MTEATIHIVDDDNAVRRSLKLLIESAGLKAHEYEHGKDFLDRYKPNKPECLLLDLRMPVMDGLTLQEELGRRDIDIATIFLTGHGDIPIAVRALRAGALDFIEKPFDNDHLLDRLRVSVETDAENEQERVDKLKAKKRLEMLTKREREVVDLLVEGKINKVIASDLGLSTRTVESHRARVMKKLGAHSLSDVFKIVLASEHDSTEQYYIRSLDKNSYD